MSVWSRFARWWKSLWGSALDSLENPEKILEQNLREMEEQVPVINENIAMIKANMTLQQSNMTKLKNKAEDLKAKIKATLQADRRDLAMNYATTLEQINDDLVDIEKQILMSEAAYEKAKMVKTVFIREKDKKRQEALRAIQKNKQAKWQKRVADAMESFEVHGIDQTHDQMIEKIEQKSALNEARMEMALDTISPDGFDVEKEAEKIRANEILKQFELEMGLISPEAAAEAEKTIGPGESITEGAAPAEPEKEEAAPEKTIGPKQKTK